uniref:Uncharacterized protein n=1 Tax=Glycine max TaxID=3847 RepID=C6TDM5_SOYBN|nr:unknown [Glycine max]
MIFFISSASYSLGSISFVHKLQLHASLIQFPCLLSENQINISYTHIVKYHEKTNNS